MLAVAPASHGERYLEFAVWPEQRGFFVNLARIAILMLQTALKPAPQSAIVGKPAERSHEL
jgi:hypothetical protein